MQLVIESLAIERGDRRVIDGLSLTVPAASALLLKGRNGSGKTTLIRAIAGLIAPTEGDLELKGGDPDQTLAEQCHLIGHQNGVKATLTVGENLSFWARYLDPDADDTTIATRIDEALDTFDLLALEDIPAAYLSAGQKRRVGLARLLLAHRPVWLLDEPTVSLDQHSVTTLATAVKQHVRCGGIAIAATHIPLGIEAAKTLELGARGAPAGNASANESGGEVIQ